MFHYGRIRDIPDGTMEFLPGASIANPSIVFGQMNRGGAKQVFF